MKTNDSKKKRINQRRQRNLTHFCLICGNKGVNMFDEPCNSCNKDFHSQHIRPRKPLHYTGGAF